MPPPENQEENYEDEFVYGEGEPVVRLRNGIDLADLEQGKGTNFEVVPEDHTKQYFEKPVKKDAYKLTNPSLIFEEEAGSNEEDEEDDSTPFDKMKKRMKPITEDGEVLKLVQKHGTGKDIPHGAVVRVHYSGFLEYADEPFDSSRLTGNIKRWKYNTGGDVIPTFDTAIGTMKKGEISYFLSSPNYNFGALGCEPRIPAQAWILWEIEVLSWTEYAEVDDFYSLTREERRNAKLDMVLKVAQAAREEAKRYFEVQSYYKAANQYKRAIQALEEFHLKDEEEEIQQKKQLLKLYINTSICYIKTHDSGRAIHFANEALGIDRNFVKGLYCKGKGLHQLGEFDRAKHFLKEAQKRCPNDKDINEELRKLEMNLKKFNLQEKETFRRMFGGSAKSDSSKEVTGKLNKAEKKAAAEAADEALECSDEFRKNMTSHLESFAKNEDLDEMPFPSQSFTLGELDCIMEACEKLDIDMHEFGEGSNAHFRFIKKNKRKTAPEKKT